MRFLFKSGRSGVSNQAKAVGARRWLWRSCVAVVLVVPVPSVLAYGCSSPTEYDDLCGFLRDPENCSREFFIDIGTRCGSTPTTRSGQFLSRDKLDLCVFAEGGQANFEPPIDLAAPPPDNVEPIKVKLINPDATECGTVEFRAKYDFSITVKGDPLPDAGVDANDLPEEFVVGGTFDMKGGKDSDTLNVSCPGGKFQFDRLQVTTCPELEAVLPHAEIDFSPGGIDQTGVIRMWIFYPPIEGALENAQPVQMNYYECFIPAAPPLCENGTKDGSETDIDCGGSFCAARCGDGQTCISNDDCISGDCALNMGLKQCNGG